MLVQTLNALGTLWAKLEKCFTTDAANRRSSQGLAVGMKAIGTADCPFDLSEVSLEGGVASLPPSEEIGGGGSPCPPLVTWVVWVFSPLGLLLLFLLLPTCLGIQ
eukprot:TRINITY_DN3220_c0_g1_i1.p3 TRINITY_DN3220_c0_g1~~TRINITY_DN3220_c0_g1_i1.p3  ORF type:complete len:105 (+),score=13.33 TRINITY_DN3220_c0_g1_i1:1448-1762(+)